MRITWNPNSWDGCDTEGVDMNASMDRYEELVAEELGDNSIAFERDQGCVLMDVQLDSYVDADGDPIDPINEEDRVNKAMDRVWDRADFWVEK